MHSGQSLNLSGFVYNFLSRAMVVDECVHPLRLFSLSVFPPHKDLETMAQQLLRKAKLYVIIKDGVRSTHI